jgi:hypothetical protein
MNEPQNETIGTLRTCCDFVGDDEIPEMVIPFFFAERSAATILSLADIVYYNSYMGM